MGNVTRADSRGICRDTERGRWGNRKTSKQDRKKEKQRKTKETEKQTKKQNRITQ